MTPPGFFGEAEVLRKVGCRQVRATALRHTSAVLIPVNVFNKMLLSKVQRLRVGTTIMTNPD